jgi:hypothetical protein
MNFLIQTINGEVKYDFSFTLLQSIEYQNWLTPDSISYKLSDDFNEPNYIPIGSVEFVSSYLETFYGRKPKPKNIPYDLMDEYFTGRKVLNGTNINLSKGNRKFVKSNDTIKSFTELTDEAPVGNYQISDIVNFESEYRCFVYKNELVGLQHYLGDFTIFPNISKIKDMIYHYKTNAPVAYTLDVGILSNSEDTVVVEVHDFFSCGLYGFSNYKILPFMFSRWFNEFINKKNT